MASLFRAYKYVLVLFALTSIDIVALFDSAALIRRPMVAQCGTAAVLFGTGDLIAQQGIEKKGLKRHDVRFIFFLS
jgi:hypothetical protein